IAGYAVTPGSDRPVMEAIHSLTLAEVASADRGERSANAASLDLVAALSLGDWNTASRLVQDGPGMLGNSALHLLAKRNDVTAVRWLVDNGADVNARAEYFGSNVTPLHMAAGSGSADMVRLLLAAGADPHVHDSRFDSDAAGWAEHFGQTEVLQILREHP
ncbi:MAG TPA: ankyrin repeat domain-containing protein, partial [Longimicrobiales bacterium]|nr:ankyrin repeat domain-containing protein [Longimicrobiales bacterium]